MVGGVEASMEILNPFENIFGAINNTSGFRNRPEAALKLQD